MNPNDERDDYIPQEPAESTEPTAPAEGTEATAPAPQPKKRPLALPIISAVAGVLGFLVAFCAVLFLPVLRTDTVTPALESALPEASELFELLEELSTKGAEGEAELYLPATLLGTKGDLSLLASGNMKPQKDGTVNSAVTLRATAGNYAHELELVKNGHILAAKGLLDAGYVTIDLSCADEILKNSILHPNSGAAGYAFSEEEYEELLKELKDLDRSGELGKKDLDVLTDAVKRVLTLCKDSFYTNSELSWIKGGFGFRKTDVLELEREGLLTVITTAKAELEENEALRDVLSRIITTTEDGEESNYLTELTRFFEELDKQWLTIGSLHVELISVQGRAARMHVVYNDTKQDSFTDITVDFYADAVSVKLVNSAEVDVSINSYSTTKATVVTDILCSLGRYEEENGLKYQLEMNVDAVATLKSGATSESSSAFNVTLMHNESDGAYRLTLTTDAEGQDSFSLELVGTSNMSRKKGAVSVTLQDIILQGESIFDSGISGGTSGGTILPLSSASDPATQKPLLRFSAQANKRTKIATPAGRSIETVTAAEADAYYATTEIAGIGDWMEAYDRKVLEENYSFDYAVQNNHVYSKETVEYVKERYGKPFSKYIISQMLAGNTEGPYVLTVYDERLDQFVLVSLYGCSDAHVNTITLSLYENGHLHSDAKKFYNHGALNEDGTVTLHTVYKAKEQEVSCEQYGFITYRCEQCAFGYAEITSWSHGHENVRYNETPAATDTFAQAHSYSIVYCKHCYRITSAETDELVLWLELQADGTYLVTSLSYFAQDKTAHYYLPELPDAFPTIAGFSSNFTPYAWQVEGFAGTLEIHSDFTKLKPSGFYDSFKTAKALVLPATLEEICSGAFHEAFVPECIYFRGTAEQWAKVRLNEYAARWQGVTVIFLGDAA